MNSIREINEFFRQVRAELAAEFPHVVARRGIPDDYDYEVVEEESEKADWKQYGF